uniref:DUF2782 domain-containing protein n=1 Tax=Candidatus Kentrum sp. LPFa TaxID=2126335 RepID=A0A450WQX6_9GAMM|nr:MAG: Protein of unknown function (DUF2782) [Candidatus Kentron sp. LPFa]
MFRKNKNSEKIGARARNTPFGVSREAFGYVHQDATMPRKKLRIIPIAAYGLFMLIFSGQPFAESKNTGPEPIPGPPPLPSVESGETLEPDITIVQGEKKTVHEYRINGHLYAIKVISRHGGPPYYMIDMDGDGNLETRKPFVRAVPQWVLFSW